MKRDEHEMGEAQLDLDDSRPVSGVHRAEARIAPSSFPARIPPALTAATVPTLAALPVLEHVERLGPDASGVLAFGNSGLILVEHGSVCWAASTSLRRRLTDLLARQSEPPLPPTRVEEVFRECRRSSKPIGESLVAAGIVTEAELHRALRQHIAEAVAMLALSHQSPVFSAKVGTRYDARFTYSTAEVLASVGALAVTELASMARSQLKQLAGVGMSCAAAFSGGSHRAVMRPIGQVGFDGRPARDLDALCSAAATLASSLPFESKLSYCETTDGTLVVWRSDDVTYVGWCDQRGASARLVSALRQRGIG